MNISTTYMGLKLRSPLVMSASPLSESIANIKRAEDAGAGAVVLFSLFEEQLKLEQEAMFHHSTYGAESNPEALHLPELPHFHVGSAGYLNLIRQAKDAVDIPIIASLNGTHVGGWTKFAQEIDQAGADGLELNVYDIPTNMEMSGAEVEANVIDILKAVKAAVRIPVAIKLSPYFSNMANMAKKLDQAGVNALVLFNRFYQPDIDLETLEVRPNVILSTPQALRLPLTWIGILYSRINASLAATSGIHSAEDVIKMLLVGADVTMMAAALIRHGVDHLRTVETGLKEWMEKNEYVSVQQMRGSVSQINSPDPTAFERTQYMRALTTYRV